MDAEERKLQTLAAVTKLSTSLQQMVQEGRASFQLSRDINDFARSRGEEDMHGLLTIYPIQLYAECFKSLGVKSRRELEALWGQDFQYEEIRESVEELLTAEESYRALIEELDKVMAEYEEQTDLPPVGVGGQLSTADISLLDARSGDKVPLENLLSKSSCTLFVLRKHYV